MTKSMIGAAALAPPMLRAPDPAERGLGRAASRARSRVQRPAPVAPASEFEGRDHRRRWLSRSTPGRVARPLLPRPSACFPGGFRPQAPAWTFTFADKCAVTRYDARCIHSCPCYLIGGPIAQHGFVGSLGRCYAAEPHAPRYQAELFPHAKPGVVQQCPMLCGKAVAS